MEGSASLEQRGATAFSSLAASENVADISYFETQYVLTMIPSMRNASLHKTQIRCTPLQQ